MTEDQTTLQGDDQWSTVGWVRLTKEGKSLRVWVGRDEEIGVIPLDSLKDVILGQKAHASIRKLKDDKAFKTAAELSQ